MWHAPISEIELEADCWEHSILPKSLVKVKVKKSSFPLKNLYGRELFVAPRIDLWLWMYACVTTISLSMLCSWPLWALSKGCNRWVIRTHQDIQSTKVCDSWLHDPLHIVFYTHVCLDCKNLSNEKKSDSIISLAKKIRSPVLLYYQ